MAKARLVAADPERAGLIDFDAEADGTGIYADSSADLRWALDVLGLSGERS